MFVLGVLFFPTKESVWIRLGRDAARDSLVVAVVACFLWGIWRTVGAKIRFRSCIALFAYFSGIFLLLTLPFIAVADSLFESYDPSLYSRLLDAGAHTAPVLDASIDAVPDLPRLIISIGYLIVLSWGCLLWGSFRPLANVSKARSFAAFAIFGSLYLAVAALEWWFSR
jgi:hypothetical protein